MKIGIFYPVDTLFTVQVYLPSFMFVIVSWVSFLIKPEVVPGRSVVKLSVVKQSVVKQSAVK